MSEKSQQFEVADSLAELKWSSVHNWIAVSFIIGMFLEGYVFFISPLATSWVVVPKTLTDLLIAWSSIWLLIGSLITGVLSDLVGRRIVYIISFIIFAIGGVGLIFSYSYVLILTFDALLNYAGGAEMQSILTATHEIFPRKNRNRTFFLFMLALLIGEATLGFVGLSTAFSSVAIQRLSVGVLLLPAIAALIFTRLKVPESVRWIEAKFGSEKAKNYVEQHFGQVPTILPSRPKQPSKSLSTSFKFIILLAAAFTNYAIYGFWVFTAGPIFFPTHTSMIIALGTGFEAIGAVPIFIFGSKLSKKALFLWASVAEFLFSAIMFITEGIWSANLNIFWVLYSLFNIVIIFQYVAEESLRPELWPPRGGVLYSA
ncbi:MAG: MFS transporter [Nitrososphaerota archaeon]|jgi:MFS family permease|nr:MFS transporter [Nitrososphaerota archaeon]MDG6935496.1 MFS transporter [Nitrososphaerota archaeon]MDG6943524.1 MFS transporter [Nitrososphaerota archaeon]